MIHREEIRVARRKGLLRLPGACDRCHGAGRVCAALHLHPRRLADITWLCYWCLNNDRRRAAGLPVIKKRRERRVTTRRR